MFKPICAQLPRSKKENLEPVIELVVEITREGREWRRIGALFTFGWPAFHLRMANEQYGPTFVANWSRRGFLDCITESAHLFPLLSLTSGAAHVHFWKAAVNCPLVARRRIGR